MRMKELLTYNNVDQSHKQCCIKQARHEDYMLYDAIFIKFTNKQK